MKTLIICQKCLEESNCNKPLILKEIPDNGIFHLRCEQGHETVTFLQQTKFELLFDLGLYALCDGYPREAITNFAAALERFYEFYIKYCCLKHNNKLKQIEDGWNQIRNQSERQYGAYIFLYMQEHPDSDLPFIDDKKPLFDDKNPKEKIQTWRELRNAVVHKGNFVSESDALKYGELVYDFLKVQINELLEKDIENVGKTIAYYMQEIHNNFAKESFSPESKGTLSIPTVISLSTGVNQKPFQVAYEEFRNNPIRKLINNERHSFEMQSSMNA